MAAEPEPTVPSKVFTDQELMAVGYAMLGERGLNPNFVDDSQITRTSFDTHPISPLQYTMQPAECSAFHLPTSDEALKDLSVGFAMGAVPLLDETDPTSQIRFTIRSAEAGRLAVADFDYTDEILSRCAQFTATEVGTDAAPQTLMMITPPSVGDRSYALMGRPDAQSGATGVGLRVLAGTISISMFRAVPSLKSEADAKPTLDAMAGVAKELIHQSLKHPPVVTPPPANAMSPQQLTDLLQSVSGPGGKKVDTAAGTVVDGTSVGPMEKCTYSDGTYYSALRGSTWVGGEFPASMTTMGSTLFIAGLTVNLVSMPTGAAQPYPFDKRAADLRDCPVIQEQVFSDTASSSTSQWTSIRRLGLDVAADSTYAIAHEHPDSGVWHLFVGARKGTLSVELATIWPVGSDPQPRADEMAAVINELFAKAGQPAGGT
ncbi:hypothetical protein RBS60_14055 [Sinomonas sp. ASV486]|uniref:hypothetical protein n=1 Tax=Sinomonas sp. ASV486 TaxID=3051170 RepID=UPI0027DD2C97|nr:hypothetical protein [Sinomonas sp. ASV486]MDQ4491321.1 hypothetical protein [Sinomonas sp. ASV486]